MNAPGNSPFTNPDYLRLFSAQVTSLIGTGVTTIALALLALDLSGDRATEVLGTALALKMVVYVFAAPLMSSIAGLLPRRLWLISLDLIRAGLVLCLPFVSQVWQIYVLVVVINLCAASFTPVFQATVPAVLGNEAKYQKALSYAQIAYSLEQIVSPTLAGILLTMLSYQYLFDLNALTFVVSAVLLGFTTLPATAETRRNGSPFRNLFAGLHIYVKTPRLQATWAMYFGIAAASAMILVNSAVYIVDHLGRDSRSLAIALTLSGAGTIVGAYATPRLLARLTHRTIMLAGSAILAASLLAGSLLPGWFALLALWFAMGVGLGLTQTPVGSLVRMSSHEHDSPAVFAANFSLSHSCWFVAYLLAGYLGSHLGWQVTFLALGFIALAATVAGALLFPAPDPLEIEHTHPELEHGSHHEHDEDHLPDALEGTTHRHKGHTHRHRYVIDEHHQHWA